MNRRLVGLAALAALLGLYLAYEYAGTLWSGGGDATAPGRQSAQPAAAKLNPLQDLDPDSYAAIVERPLFNPSRQPRPAEPVATPEPPAVQPPPEPPPPPPAPQGPGPEDYKLLGVSSGPDGRIAALRIAASGDVVYVRKGESVDSWTVVDIGDRSIALGAAENPVTYSLFAAAEGAGDGSEQVPADLQLPVPGQSQPLPLPLPLPVPRKQQPGAMPDRNTIPDTGG